MDNGVRLIGELDGQVDTALSRDFGFIENDGVRTQRVGDAIIGDEGSDHGTPVAAIIAARNDGIGMQGLAPDARIVSLRVDSVVDGEERLGVGRALAIRHAADSNIPVVNMSLVRTDAELGPDSAFQDAIRYYNQTIGGLLVNSVGNFGEAGPRNLIDLSAQDEQSWLFVAALVGDGRNYDIASYSNQCGAAMSRCVVAPGASIAMNVNGGESRFSGTSASSAMVSAVAAMLLSKWPQLRGVDAGNIIINTARDLGEAGPDAVYGHGLVDVEAALKPENPQISNGVVAAPANNTVMLVSNAFGALGAASIKSALSQVTVLDDYGRDFLGDISGLVIRPFSPDNMQMQRMVEAQANSGSARFESRIGSATIGYASFDTGLPKADGLPLFRTRLNNAQITVPLDKSVSVAAEFNTPQNVMADTLGLAPTSDAVLAYIPSSQTSFGVRVRAAESELVVSGHFGRSINADASGLTLGWRQRKTSIKIGIIDEQGTVFGTPVGTGILRFGDGARTHFVEAAGGVDLGSWGLDGFASIGATQLRLGDDTLLTDADTIVTGRFGFVASRPALNGRINLGLAQQMIALAGDATVTTSHGYDVTSRSLLFYENRVNLAGQLDPQFTIGFQKGGPRSQFHIGAASNAFAQNIRGFAIWTITFGSGGALD
jgi:hypothetical protein